MSDGLPICKGSLQENTRSKYGSKSARITSAFATCLGRQVRRHILRNYRVHFLQCFSSDISIPRNRINCGLPHIATLKIQDFYIKKICDSEMQNPCHWHLCEVS